MSFVEMFIMLCPYLVASTVCFVFTVFCFAGLLHSFRRNVCEATFFYWRYCSQVYKQLSTVQFHFFAILGSGSTYVYGYCDSHFKKGMSKKECVQFTKNGWFCSVRTKILFI